MNVTRLAVRNYMTVLVLCAGILTFGVWTYLTLPREAFPEVKIPFVIVTARLDGASPQDVETSLTIPLETELNGVEGLKEMRSTSADSMVTISLEFDPEVATEVALRRVRDAVDTAKGDLPQEADEPIVKEFSLNEEFPVLVFNLVGGDDTALSELRDLADRIEDELETVPGVLDVNVEGGREREVLVEVDPERLHFYDLPLSQVQGLLQGSNRNVSAGAAVLPELRLVMRAPGEFKSAGEIMALVVGTGRDGVPIYMRDVASVRYAFADETSRARLYDFSPEGGAPRAEWYVEPRKAVSIMVQKKTGANIIGVIDACRETAGRFALPASVELVVVQNLAKEVRTMVSDLENGIGTALILVLVVIFFGMGFRNAVLVSWVVPFTMLASIVVVALMGYTLNNMVLYSLIMSLGMLVDNGVVVVENIYRHHSLGAPRAEAAVTATTEVGWAVSASTATTVAAFLPIAFWPGVIGEFMSYLPVTLMVVLTSSLMVAIVINPTLCSLLIKLQAGAEKTMDPQTQRPTYRLARVYGRFLGFLLDRPVWTVATAFLLLALTFVANSVFGRGTEFFPSLDPNRLIVSVTPPDGTSIDGTDRYLRAAEDRIFGKPGSGFDRPVANLDHAGVTAALAGGQNTGPGAIRIEFVDRVERTESSALTVTAVRRRLEGLDGDGNRVAPPLYGADYDVITPEEGPPTGKPVSIDIFGEDLGQMAAVVGDMKAIMASVPGVAKPTDDAATAQPTLEWRVDKPRAAMVGLDQASVARAIQMSVGGLKAGTFGHGDDEQDIVVRLPEEYRVDTRRLKNVFIPTPAGGSVPVSSVASAELVAGPVEIKHLDRKRVLTAGAEVEPWVKADATVRAEFQKRVAGYVFPPGITRGFGGAAEEEEKSRAFLGKAFMIALFLIAMVMVAQFNSLLVPSIVMISILLSFIGVFFGLLVFDKPFGIIMGGIGVISLAGVVVNNGIILLDAIRQWERRGLAVREAIVTACMIRLRPVLLTVSTTILGLVPMAFRFGVDFRSLSIQYDTESSQWWQSMAVVIIFGLLVSTALTLGVTPTVYLLYERLREKLRPKPADLSPSADG